MHMSLCPCRSEIRVDSRNEIQDPPKRVILPPLELLREQIWRINFKGFFVATLASTPSFDTLTCVQHSISRLSYLLTPGFPFLSNPIGGSSTEIPDDRVY
jgi:hypothetical protein